MKRRFSICGLLFTLAFAAMGVRAVAPPGYMFASNGRGIVVTLCGGATMRVDFGKHAPAQRHRDTGPCLFAAAAHAAPAPAAAAPTPIPVRAIHAPPASMPARIGHGLAAPPPPSTGPPHLP